LVEDHYCYAVLYIFDQLHFHLFWWPWSVMAILGITSGFSQRGQNYDFKNVQCMIILRNVFRFITKYFVNCLS
jgi:predicted membrane protein